MELILYPCIIFLLCFLILLFFILEKNRKTDKTEKDQKYYFKFVFKIILALIVSVVIGIISFYSLGIYVLVGLRAGG